VLFETNAAIVVMDGQAAGSGGVGPVWHGRVGDGATLTLDVAPVAAQRGGATRNPVFQAFHIPAPRQQNIGRAAQQAAAAAGGRARGKRGE
jgi:hypothetical protein